MTYSDKLKDPRWQKKRLQILERDNWECQECGEKGNTLHVHHKNYYLNKDPWDCKDNNLITYCFKCHDMEHHYKQELNDFIHDLLLIGYTHANILFDIKNYYGIIK